MKCLNCGNFFKRGQAGQQRYCSVKCRILSAYDVSENGCWIWKKSCFKAGYGAINVGGKITYAHRLSYEIFNGPIENGMFVMHVCDEPACINPGHLIVGSPLDNVQDMMAKGRNHWANWPDEKRKKWIQKILDGQKQSPLHNAYAGNLKDAG